MTQTNALRKSVAEKYQQWGKYQWEKCKNISLGMNIIPTIKIPSKCHVTGNGYL